MPVWLLGSPLGFLVGVPTMTDPMRTYPIWNHAPEYEVAAIEAVEQMRDAITANEPGKVVDHIDAALKALHQLRQAAVAEHHDRLTALLERAAAESAKRAARPAEPSPAVVEAARELAARGMPVGAIGVLRDNTSMTLVAAREYVEGLGASTTASNPVASS
jgi:hypothetical protein